MLQEIYNANANKRKMTPLELLIWLHGYLEISDPKTIGEKETQIIKDHLNQMFEKQTPDRNEEEKTDLKEDLCEAEEEIQEDKVDQRDKINLPHIYACRCNIFGETWCPQHGVVHNGGIYPYPFDNGHVILC